MPSCGFTDHVTAVLVVPLTIAVKVALWPPLSDALPGDKLRPTVGDRGGSGSETGVPSNTVAVAVFVESTLLVAEIVTSVSCVTAGGASYTPLTRLPRFGLMDHCTWSSGVPWTIAVNTTD